MFRPSEYPNAIVHKERHDSDYHSQKSYFTVELNARVGNKRRGITFKERFEDILALKVKYGQCKISKIYKGKSEKMGRWVGDMGRFH